MSRLVTAFAALDFTRTQYCMRCGKACSIVFAISHVEKITNATENSALLIWSSYGLASAIRFDLCIL